MRVKTVIFLIVLILLVPGIIDAESAQSDSVEKKCITCHKVKSPGLYRQWANSAHGANDVTCIDCHSAEKGDQDGFMHNNALIATLVTPKDCGQCHEQEMQEVDHSHHAKAGMILESADAYLANTAGGHPAAVQGCESCHGCKVKIDPNSANKLSREQTTGSGILFFYLPIKYSSFHPEAAQNHL